MKRIFQPAKYIGLAGITAVIGIQPLNAAFIQPDSVFASSSFGSSYAPENTIDGSGLPAGFGPSSAHAEYSSASGGNHWTTAAGTDPTEEWIEWVFSSPQELSAAYIWNHQSSQPLSNNTGYDVTLFDLYLFDIGGTVLLFLNDVPLAANTATGQTISFGSSIPNVSSVLFDIEAVEFSPNYTGLAEVAFETGSVVGTPELGSTLLSGLIGLGSLGLLRRRISK